MVAAVRSQNTATSRPLQPSWWRRGGSLFQRWRQLVGLGVLAIGLSALTVGAYVPAKAWLGQHLLSAAFADAQQSGAGTKPWAWADFTAIARIKAPRIGAEAIALNASTGAAMAWGPGAVLGLDRPDADLVAFAGHRDTHFAFLGELRPGDEVSVEALDGTTRAYRVTGGAVVDSRQWRFPTEGEGLLLLTCWPLTAHTQGPLRLVITAEPAISIGRPEFADMQAL